MTSSEGPIRVSFIIPLYFTGEGVAKLFDAFRTQSMPGPSELILVNDGSTDVTVTRVRELAASMPMSVTLVDMARNYGEHAAVLEGFRHARGEFIVNLDDDLQNPISEAVRLVEHLQTSGADVVYAYYSEKKHHWFRNFGSWLTNTVATFLLDKPKDLYLCSFRAMRRDLATRITRYVGPYPYVDGLILNATNRIDRLLVEHQSRADGESGYTLRKLLRLWMNMFFNFSIMPLRIASLGGMTLCFLGALFLLVALAEYCFMGARQTGWTSLMAALCIFSGSQLLILGVLGEYVGRIFMTLSGKPQSLVREIHKNGFAQNANQEQA